MTAGHFDFQLHWRELGGATQQITTGTQPAQPASDGVVQKAGSGDYYREQIWVTPSGMFNQHQLDHVVAELGAERIIYSADFP